MLNIRYLDFSHAKSTYGHFQKTQQDILLIKAFSMVSMEPFGFHSLYYSSFNTVQRFETCLRTIMRLN